MDSEQRNPTVRRKVTFACDTCRKRRAKCSGTQPCTYCATRGQTCMYDEKNRSRRGPKPRQPQRDAIRERPMESEPARTLLPLAAAPSSPSITVVVRESGTSPDTLVEGDTANYDSYSDEEITQADTSRTTDWTSRLAPIIFPQAYLTSEWERERLSLISHLVGLYWDHSSVHLGYVLPPQDLDDQIREGSCPKHLILAVCACNVRYSTHKAAKPVGEVGKDMALCARQELASADCNKLDISRILTHCCLSEFEICRGNGAAAWADLGTCTSLLQMMNIRKGLTLSHFDTGRRIKRYLSMMQSCYQLGNPSLRAELFLSIKDAEDQPHDDSLSYLSSVLQTLVRIQIFCETPLTLSILPPWLTESKFYLLRDELDRYLIQQPHIFGYQGKPSNDMADTLEAHQSVCALLWHCCVITLNRTLLPIPSCTGNDEESSTAKAVHFPGAPSLFIEEVICRCEASATSIPVICKQLIVDGNFFHYLPWLGYSCLQSCMVLLSRPRLQEGIDEDKEEAFSLAHQILMMTGNFFIPAYDWIDAVSCVQKHKSEAQQSSIDPNASFTSFLDRFDGLTEPPFIPLEPRSSCRIDAHSVERSLVPSQLPKTPMSQAVVDSPKHDWEEAYAGFLDNGDDLALNPINEGVGSAAQLTSQSLTISKPWLLDNLEEMAPPVPVDPKLQDLGAPSTLSANTSALPHGETDLMDFSPSSNPIEDYNMWVELLS